MNDDVIITNQEKIEATKKRIVADGLAKLQVVSDFDKTLTTCFVNGKKIVSLISILRDEHYLTPDYSGKAQALYDKYHPIEIDPTIPMETKKEKMREWWLEHYELLAKSGLSKQDLAKVAQSEKVSLRTGALVFFDRLKAHDIPLLILSAAGLGVEAISLYLQKYGKLYGNIHIASNTFVWDENGQMIKAREPIIHSFNKDYTSVRNFSFFVGLGDRRNIILLGDSTSDVTMINGFNYDQIIKIGFLNENMADQLIAFKDAYDIIILNNGSMDYVNELLKELLKQ